MLKESKDLGVSPGYIMLTDNVLILELQVSLQSHLMASGKFCTQKLTVNFGETKVIIFHSFRPVR